VSCLILLPITHHQQILNKPDSTFQFVDYVSCLDVRAAAALTRAEGEHEYCQLVYRVPVFCPVFCSVF
jgi:hypothetical protein